MTSPAAVPAVPASQRRAAERALAVIEVHDAIAAGASKTAAVDAVAAAAGCSPRALWRWVKKTEESPRQAAVEVLRDRPRSGQPTIWSQPGAEDAWKLWLTLYERRERPHAITCWRRVRAAAELHG